MLLDLPPLVASFGPSCLLVLQTTCRRLRDLPEAVLAWYWQQLLSAALPSPELVRFVGPARGGELYDAAHWRQAFLDLDLTFLCGRLLRTAADYGGFHRLVKRVFPPQPPPHVVFDTPTSVRLDPACPLGGDRMVVGSAPLPAMLSCTPVQSGSEWHLGYRMVQGYFELTLGAEGDVNGPGVAFAGREACVSIGMCTPDLDPITPSRRQVGWCRHSWGLHGDDGQLYHARGFGVPFHPLLLQDLEKGVAQPRRAPRAANSAFGLGDTVGCGVLVLPGRQGHNEVFTRGVFFTRNGQFLGTAFRLEVPCSCPLHPCFGIDAHWRIEANFGAKPFRFALDQLGHLCVPPRRTAVPSTPTSRSYFVEPPSPPSPATPAPQRPLLGMLQHLRTRLGTFAPRAQMQVARIKLSAIRAAVLAAIGIRISPRI